MVIFKPSFDFVFFVELLFCYKIIFLKFRDALVLIYAQMVMVDSLLTHCVFFGTVLG